MPVRTGQTSAQAVAASLDLVARADALGYRRYWFAEHHNMPAVASTTPPVLIAAAAARTERIRVGSGGVMLPNHSPLVVAEQFAALEALAPGRIDLGIGRAPGSDPVITQLLRQSGTTSDVERFPDHIRDILVARLDRRRDACASPAAARTTCTRRRPPTARPRCGCSGSSDYSAQLAAALGLPYVFANHFSGQGLERALDLYRAEFQPSEAHPRRGHSSRSTRSPRPTAEEAEARSLPQPRMMARLRTNKPLTALETVEQARAGAPTSSTRWPSRSWPSARANWFVGTGADVRPQLAAFAARYGVDEVMISPIAGAFDGEPMDAATGRAQTLELLAAAPSGGLTPALRYSAATDGWSASDSPSTLSATLLEDRLQRRELDQRV